jgi:hypothetical protein
MRMHDAEGPNGRADGAGGSVEKVEAQLRRGRMRAVRLDDDGAASRERGGGVAAGNGERQREVAGPEPGDRAERDEHGAQVGSRSYRGAGQFAVEAARAEGGLPVGDGHDRIALGLQSAGEGVEKRGTPVPAESVERFDCGDCGAAAFVDLSRVGFGGDDLEGFAGPGIDAGDVGHQMPF